MHGIPKGKIIRDAVHGDIFVEDKFLKIIDTPEFQRMRRIKQLSVANIVFPSADHYQDDSGHKAYDYQIEIELKSDYIHRVNLKMLTDDLERKVSKLESSTESKYKRGLTKLSVQ